jgi:hypothetical protein
MPLVVCRHKVKDFTSWKKSYDAFAGARTAAGLTNGRVTRSADDPNELVLLFDAANLDRAKAFSASESLRTEMQGAGVIDKPDLYFLTDAG